MFTSDCIHRVDKLIEKAIELPEEPGVYAFWWMGEKKKLTGGNTKIFLKGPKKTALKGQKKTGLKDPNKQWVWVEVEYKDWWPTELPYPCLYIGRSRNIKDRFPLHIINNKPHRLHCDPRKNNNRKAKPYRTSCQLRFGIEHVFPDEENTLEIIRESVGFSYALKDSVVERFFEEKRLIGTCRPWFNINCER